MNEEAFEGSIILEQLARIGGVDDFIAAADGQDYEKAEALMRKAGIDEETIAVTLKKMADPYDEH